MLNLVSNAIKFTERGGTVTVSAGVEGPRLIVRVADNFHIEVDQNGALAGFWMSNVPPFTAFEDEM